MNQSNTTPLMVQYLALRQQHQALLLFQVGDFYELFFDDAITASRILGIALTKRGEHEGKPIPLCGVPIHAIDHYLAKLIKAGLPVAIADQLEPPRPGTVVKRGITRVLTPATLTDARLLDEKKSSYLCACFIAYDEIALIFGELMTGALVGTCVDVHDTRGFEAQLNRFMPDEIIVEGVQQVGAWRTWLKQQAFVVSDSVSVKSDTYDEWRLRVAPSVRRASALERALECFYSYVEHQGVVLDQFTQFARYTGADFLVIDAATARNLELVGNNRDGSRAYTLLSILDRAVTAMGSRLIKKWIMSPLIGIDVINRRLDAVQVLVSDISTSAQLGEYLLQILDIERVVGRIALKRTQVHDFMHLQRALIQVPKIKRALEKLNTVLMQSIEQQLLDFSALADLLGAAINDDMARQWLIKPGFDHELDHARSLVEHANDRLVELERVEQEATGITSLKIRYNQVYGYYLEVTKANEHLVPERYRRQQTLANRQRFTTPELIALENELTKAQAEIAEIERRVYERVITQVYDYVPSLRACARALAHLDTLLAFALTAYDNAYVRPVLHEESDIVIEQGKHPVLGAVLGTDFIANDTHLTSDQRVWIVTGPNMGGKSTYLRQVALISLMAHCGSFVPARAARIPILDRIFTRVGAGDQLAEGKSTFLVEMEETALICTQATQKSLIILDEVGRGTSTYDGLAIAQAVVEYVHAHIGACCLFATHYHELTHLADVYAGIVNYHATSVKKPSGVIFLHKIVSGAAQGSFGIEVAQLAKVPAVVVERAREILKNLDTQQVAVHQQLNAVVPAQAVPDERLVIVDELEKLDLDDCSPRQVYEWIGRAQQRARRLSSS